MKTVMLDNCIVMYPLDMLEEEALQYAQDEIQEWTKQGKRISTITIDIDGEEVVISAKQRSPITRVRRITGYCSNVNNFNDAKLAELKDREQHIKGMK